MKIRLRNGTSEERHKELLSPGQAETELNSGWILVDEAVRDQ
jgi:hypothetical protein